MADVKHSTLHSNKANLHRNFADLIDYTPATSSNWSPQPGTVNKALDQIAGAINLLGDVVIGLQDNQATTLKVGTLTSSVPLGASLTTLPWDSGATWTNTTGKSQAVLIVCQLTFNVTTVGDFNTGGPMAAIVADGTKYVGIVSAAPVQGLHVVNLVRYRNVPVNETISVQAGIGSTGEVSKIMVAKNGMEGHMALNNFAIIKLG